MLVNCKNCGIEFKTLACYIRRGGGKYCSVKCNAIGQLGRPATKGRTGMLHSEETKEKMRKNNAKFWLGKKNPYLTGNKNPNWNGGNTKERLKIWRSELYKEWRTAVFKRDNWTCVWCGATGYVEADHIKPFAFFPELRFEISNGRTLCKRCHNTTKWGRPNKDPELLKQKLNVAIAIT